MGGKNFPNIYIYIFFLHFPKEDEGGLDVQTWRWVPHENGDLHNDEGMVFFAEGRGHNGWYPCWLGEADEVTHMVYYNLGEW